MSASDALRVIAIVRRAGLPYVGPSLGDERYLELMRVDKKSVDGRIQFVLLRSLGHAEVGQAPDATVREVLAAHTLPDEVSIAGS